MIATCAFQLATRFIGVKEIPGSKHNPQVMAMLKLDNAWPAGDEVPWCSAFVNYICWLLGLQRSKSLAARSWLRVGMPVELAQAEVENDIVILKRGGGGQPGPDVIAAPGHVGFYAGWDDGLIHVLGGNQSDSINVQRYSTTNLLGIRRLSLN